MDRTEAQGFGVAVAGHAALLALMAFAVGQAAGPPRVPDSMEVSFVEDVGRFSAAPQPVEEPPAPAEAPDLGPIEDAAPAPTADPAPPQPSPRAPARPIRSEPRPAPKQAAPTPQRPTQPTARTGQQTTRPRLGSEILKGIGNDPSPSRSTRPAARMTGQAAASIAQAIARQVQPCADRQVYPGPGAERIVTRINLRLKPDGSLAAPPRVVGQSGTDLENGRYARRVADLAIRSFMECSPLRGLPAELYGVTGGWSNFDMNYRMPG